MTDNIPPEIARIPPDGMTYEEAGIAALRNAPVRISPEVRETIVRALCRDKGDDLERAIHAFGREPKGANANYIDQLKATRAKIERAIAFVEALP